MWCLYQAGGRSRETANTPRWTGVTWRSNETWPFCICTACAPVTPRFSRGGAQTHQEMFRGVSCSSPTSSSSEEESNSVVLMASDGQSWEQQWHSGIFLKKLLYTFRYFAKMHVVGQDISGLKQPTHKHGKLSHEKYNKTLRTMLVILTGTRRYRWQRWYLYDTQRP